MSEPRRHIPVGNRGPRTPKRVKAPTLTTTVALIRVRTQLLTVGVTSNEVMRHQVIPMDRQRFYRLRDRLVEAGAITYEDRRPWPWEATTRLERVTVQDLYGHLKPWTGPSNTHPGMVQLDCPFCGLKSKVFPTEREALAWHYDTHIKTGVAHQ